MVQVEQERICEHNGGLEDPEEPLVPQDRGDIGDLHASSDLFEIAVSLSSVWLDLRAPDLLEG